MQFKGFNVDWFPEPNIPSTCLVDQNVVETLMTWVAHLEQGLQSTFL